MTKREMTIPEAFKAQGCKRGGITVYGGNEPKAYAIARTYRWYRFHGNSATNALAKAKVAVEMNAAKYPAYGETKFGAPFVNGGGVRGDKLRWIENPAKAGLRFVAKTDVGYHVEWGDDAFYGAVFLLPGRNGETQMVAGYLDPYNDGPAAICFDEVFIALTECESDLANSDGYVYAMLSADDIAQVACESEREFREKDRREQEAEELQQTIRDLRQERRNLLAEVRKTGGLPPAICDSLRKRVYSIRRESREAHKRLAAIESGR